MRRSLIGTVAATTVMVLLAMLIPMAFLVEEYALEDRLARAALEVQATETVVSGAGDDPGTVSVYLDSINTDGQSVLTTVLYPDGDAIGPVPGEDERVQQARETGRARVDDVADGTELLVPVALGGSSALPEDTPVIRVTVLDEGFAGRVWTTWGVLAALGLALLGLSLFLADRLGRRFVQPIRSLARTAQRLGDDDLETRATLEGPREVQEVGAALNRLVERVTRLLQRERETVADLSHRLRTPITALRLAVESMADRRERERLAADVDVLDRMVDEVVREGRRSQREGLAPRADVVDAVSAKAAFWRPLAEDQGRTFDVSTPSAEVAVRASRADLDAMLDVLLDNVFSHTAEGVAVRITVAAVAAGGAELTVEDDGPGFPAEDVTGRGVSSSGSTGLGLSIARRTAEESGGAMLLERTTAGGARVVVRLGPAG